MAALKGPYHSNFAFLLGLWLGCEWGLRFWCTPVLATLVLVPGEPNPDHTTGSHPSGLDACSNVEELKVSGGGMITLWDEAVKAPHSGC